MKIKWRVIFIVMVLALTGCRGSAQENSLHLTKEQKQEDVEYFFDYLSEYYVYQDILEGSPSVLFKACTNERKTAIDKIVNTKSDLDFINNLIGFCYSLGNLHTNVFYYNGGYQYYDFVEEPLISREDFLSKQEKWRELLKDDYYTRLLGYKQ